MGALQDKMKAKLADAGIAHKSIEVYGSQIVVTSHCRKTAETWAALLATFSRVRGITESFDAAAANKGTCLNPTQIRAYRTFAAI